MRNELRLTPAIAHDSIWWKKNQFQQSSCRQNKFDKSRMISDKSRDSTSDGYKATDLEFKCLHDPQFEFSRRPYKDSKERRKNVKKFVSFKVHRLCKSQHSHQSSDFIGWSSNRRWHLTRALLPPADAILIIRTRKNIDFEKFDCSKLRGITTNHGDSRAKHMQMVCEEAKSVSYLLSSLEKKVAPKREVMQWVLPKRVDK
jgi:hypothetical protein